MHVPAFMWAYLTHRSLHLASTQHAIMKFDSHNLRNKMTSTHLRSRKSPYELRPQHIMPCNLHNCLFPQTVTRSSTVIFSLLNLAGVLSRVSEPTSQWFIADVFVEADVKGCDCKMGAAAVFLSIYFRSFDCCTNEIIFSLVNVSCLLESSFATDLSNLEEQQRLPESKSSQ